MNKLNVNVASRPPSRPAPSTPTPPPPLSDPPSRPPPPPCSATADPESTLGRWLRLSPGQAHDLGGLVKADMIEGFVVNLASEPAAVRGRPRRALSASCAEKYGRVVNKITEPGGLAPYGITLEPHTV